MIVGWSPQIGLNGFKAPQYRRGRLSIFTGVAVKDVREEQVPTVVAPEGFQAPQSFIAGATPKLAGLLEPALILAAGGFQRPAALRFAGPPRGRIVHPSSMVFQTGHFGLDGLSFLLAQAFGQGAQVV